MKYILTTVLVACLAAVTQSKDQGSGPGLGPGATYDGGSTLVYCTQKDFWGTCAMQYIAPVDYSKCWKCKSLHLFTYTSTDRLLVNARFTNNIGAFKAFDPSVCCTFYTDATCGYAPTWGRTTQSLGGSINDMWATCPDPRMQGHLASYQCGKCGLRYQRTTAAVECGLCARVGPCYGEYTPGTDGPGFGSPACDRWGKDCPNQQANLPHGTQIK